MHQVHSAEDQGVHGDVPSDGGHMVPEAILGAEDIPQELPEGDVEQGVAVPEPRGSESERQGAEAGAEGEVQELQRIVRRDSQDTELVGGQGRAAPIRAQGLHICGCDPCIQVIPWEVLAVFGPRETNGEVHKVPA